MAMAAYPEKPIQLIVPWAAGGGSDAAARGIAAALEKELGVTINVVNRAGGNGVVGHSVMASARPDGYTLGFITGELNMMHWQGLTKLTYENFTPIAMTNYDYPGVQVAANAPYDSVSDLLETIRTQPKGTIKASGTGLGGIWHVAFAGLLLEQGIEPDKITFVPSQGAAPAMVELAAGSIQLVPTSVPEARSMIDAGRAKGLAILSPERNPAFPDIPTLKESLGSDYSLGEWRGIAGPKNLPPEIVATLEAALEKAYNSELYQDYMHKLGFGIEWRNAADFSTFLEKNNTYMGGIIEKIGMKK
ncbi:tripartite tricarboxylate transporter substrate-binding protein [Pseudomonas daroniae]|uniref:Tripartite tricarboxylate transporter substrate-binding protein n=2 Tax=Phytopseudomonas daroniae TaxID=2487519 RepID=A0A4Q9QRT5_9GAMM|nr:tripartite tricarboxylate transporter substrate-binding protein [Pseudomonas daroniae]TBU82952.1 tripartite tricarboxylate transporter substrate-binding protein [Pseudomonas daroniae]TBU86172.1 tripartite tricarboxylate transporter substrate-binding protein [Pseudomonas sp. FRB 228]TBU95335.1 tripartite tricarboxylate transporter substrate-binding protein [Pseudomonas daroniae]